MPELLAIRFESVGHRDARLENLVLRFDHLGQPTDSVVWLRNGGGKSSILNLFFSVIRPSLRDFLGAEADGKLRRLQDYVDVDDTSSVCLEWRLDEGARLITGVCAERGKSGDANDVPRLWYSLRSQTNDGRLLLDRLPLTLDDNGRRCARRLGALRPALEEFAIAEGMDARFTRVQREWEKTLSDFKLDPEIFGYQLKMNKAEGAADQLFRFASANDFIDFVLDLAVRPEDADGVGQVLQKYRDQLNDQPRLRREAIALECVRSELEPVSTLFVEREAAVRSLVECSFAAATLRASLHAGIDALEVEGQQLKQRAATEGARYAEAGQRRNRARWAATFHDAQALEIEAVDAEAASADATARHTRLVKHLALLVVAHDLEAVQKLEVLAETVREELSRRLDGSRPLFDILRTSASELVEAIGAALATVVDRQGLLQQAEESLESRRESLEQEAVEQSKSAARLETLLEVQRTELEALNRARTTLIENGTLDDSEDVRRRLQRLVVETTETRKAAEKNDGEAAVFRERVESARRQSTERTSAAKIRRAESKALADSARAARASYRTIASSGAVQQALESNDVNLLENGDRSLNVLDRQSGLFTEELLRLRLESQRDARALDALERTGLLPPSVDAEHVERALRGAGVAAFSGFSFLAENAQPDIAEQRVRTRPDLASGVVVDEGTLERAAKVLEDAVLLVDIPVSVGTKTALLSDGAPQTTIVVQPPRGYFDRTSAQAERATRETRNANRRAQEVVLSVKVRALDDARASFRSLLVQHPPLTIVANESSAMLLEREAVSLEEQAAIDDSDANAALLRARDAEAVGNSMRARLPDLARLETELNGLIARGIDDLAQRTQVCQRLGEERASAAERERVARESLASSREEEALLSKRREELAIEARLLENERAPVVGDAGDLSVQGPLGDVIALDVARERYRLARSSYDQQTGGDVFRAIVETREQQANDARLALSERVHAENISLEDVALALAAAESTAGRADAERRARLELGIADKARIDLAVAARDARNRADDRKRAMRSLVDEGRGSYLQELASRAEGWNATQHRVAHQQETESAATAREIETEASVLRDEARRALEALGTSREKVGGALRRVDDAIVALPEVAAVANSVSRGALEGAAEHEPSVEEVSTIVDTLRSLGNAVRAFDERATKLQSELARFSHDAACDDLPPTLRDRLRERDLVVLLTRAPDMVVDVRQRLDVIADELKSSENHRSLVVAELHHITERALRLIRSLERCSILPSNVEVWGGQPFIKISLQVPAQGPERDAVAIRLIDALVEKGESPTGVGLVKRMVRELARAGSLSVKILKPEAHRRLQWVPVDTLGAFSGGERLTAAILLYCALVRVRAEQRGLRDAARSVLLLDNPIGACSLPELVALQRDMARAHGVQLIYTTGVDDLEALALLPNRVRLKNAHLDGRGRRRITEDPQAVEVVRILAVAEET